MFGELFHSVQKKVQKKKDYAYANLKPTIARNVETLKREVARGFPCGSNPPIRDGESPSSPGQDANALRLAHLDKFALRSMPFWVTNAKTTCSSCKAPIDLMSGVVPKECRSHDICRECIVDEVLRTEGTPKCPARSCGKLLWLEEVEALRDRFGGRRKNTSLESGSIPRPLICEEYSKDTAELFDDRSGLYEECGPALGRGEEPIYENIGRPSRSCKNDILPDLSYLENPRFAGKTLWPTKDVCDCDACGGSIGIRQGFIFKACLKHQICKSCALEQVFSRAPRCPGPDCSALISRKERIALVRLGQTILEMESSSDSNEQQCS